MNTKKIIGYIICLAGLFGIALTFPVVAKTLNITIPAQITTQVLTIASIILILIGVVLLYTKKGSSGKVSEVPIYHGDKIVGYRRHKN